MSYFGIFIWALRGGLLLIFINPDNNEKWSKGDNPIMFN